MSERERLIELLCNVDCNGADRREGGCSFRQDSRCNVIQKLDMCMVETIADHLLANGVIVPPVKIGQTVYDYAGRECVVFGIHFFYEGINSFATERIGYNGCRIHTTHSFDKIDETVFLTREEAKKALEGKT